MYNVKSSLAALFNLIQQRQAAQRHTKIAQAYYRHGRFAEAVLEYQQALKLQPDATIVRFNLGLALYKSGQRQQARAEWKTVLDLTRGKNAYLTEQTEIMLRQFS